MVNHESITKALLVYADASDKVSSTVKPMLLSEAISILPNISDKIAPSPLSVLRWKDLAESFVTSLSLGEAATLAKSLSSIDDTFDDATLELIIPFVADQVVEVSEIDNEYKCDAEPLDLSKVEALLSSTAEKVDHLLQAEQKKRKPLARVKKIIFNLMMTLYIIPLLTSIVEPTVAQIREVTASISIALYDRFSNTAIIEDLDVHPQLYRHDVPE